MNALIEEWRSRAKREARQSIANVYLECAAQLEEFSLPPLISLDPVKIPSPPRRKSYNA